MWLLSENNLIGYISCLNITHSSKDETFLDVSESLTSHAYALFSHNVVGNLDHKLLCCSFSGWCSATVPMPARRLSHRPLPRQLRRGGGRELYELGVPFTRLRSHGRGAFPSVEILWKEGEKFFMNVHWEIQHDKGMVFPSPSQPPFYPYSEKEKREQLEWWKIPDTLPSKRGCGAPYLVLSNVSSIMGVSNLFPSSCFRPLLLCV